MAQDDTLTLMARRIKQLMTTVQRLSDRMKVLEKKETFRQDVDQEDTTCPYIFYTCRVTSIVVSEKMFYGKIQHPYTTNSSPWEDDSDFTDLLTVSVPTTTSVPSIGDIVRVDFTGTYGSTFIPRYGLFGLSPSHVSSVGPTITNTLSLVSSLTIVSGVLYTYTRIVTVLGTPSDAATTATTIGTMMSAVGSLRVSSLDLQASFVTARVFDVSTIGAWTAWHTGTECTT